MTGRRPAHDNGTYWQTLAMCPGISVQEAVYGTKLLAKLEAIKEAVVRARGFVGVEGHPDIHCSSGRLFVRNNTHYSYEPQAGGPCRAVWKPGSLEKGRGKQNSIRSVHGSRRRRLRPVQRRHAPRHDRPRRTDLGGRLGVPTALPLEVQRDVSEGAVVPVLPYVDELPLPVALQYEDRVGLLRRLGAPVERRYAQLRPLLLLPGVDDERHVDVVLGRELAELLDGDVLHVELVERRAPRGVLPAYHELHVV
ncbi:hypothetical protein THAOC_33292 [Thalassiosira oceanica]|uniref:Uncharacterized protein n=1 Tax=Thalassiosira oceanica TaxID=159749 RepID=K0RMJ1_THAOC|nr:hypothetical protein THAOC_33292 [Thalassiosira oceanica]|eukprot:EJK47952.1 hypothetical protein THAOC_33292 [Thalassiosira oceanica]